MRVRMLGVALIAACVIAAPIVLAQEMPKPSPEMAKIDYFKGSWTCQGTAKDSPMGPGGKTSSTAQIQTDLGGFWQTGTIKATMANMPPMEGRFHTTYDPAAKQFVMLWMDSSGGWARNTSAGWQGDKMVFEGEGHMPGMAKPIPGRDTFTKTSAGMTHVWEAQMDGKWTALGEETCTKK